MVELRKRKTPPPAPEPKPKKERKTKAKTASNGDAPAEKVPEKALEKAPEKAPEPEAVAEPSTAAPEITAKEEEKPAKKAKSGPPKTGETIDLEGFGGEVETNEERKVTLKSLVDESEAGVVLFTYPKASTPGCRSSFSCLNHLECLRFAS